MKKKLLLGALLLLSITSFGIPAKRGLRTVTQPDGTVLTVQKIGDEHAHYYVTSDNILLQKDEDGFFKYAIAKNGQLTSGDVIAKDPAARTNAEMQYVRQIDQSSLFKTAQSNRQKNMARRNSFSRSAAFPSKGEVNGLVLLVEFNDVRFKTANPQAAFTNHLNQENYTLNNATGSVRDYFIDQSSGSFRPKFDTYGPITLKKNMALYGGNDNYGDDADPAGMVVDACQLAASQFGVDFSKYDLDNNGIVDLVYVIYAGYGEAQSGIEDNIWPHAWDILGGGYKLNLNGKDIRSYACSSELSGFTGTTLDGIGTLCHEFSHCLGLP
ncbi:MAG: M6 family metalloprotease domain-containing protein, partial [Bacteroidales bacterium]